MRDHVNADKCTKLISRYSVTSAAPHDSTEVTNIVDSSDKILHADSAYRSKTIESFLVSIGCQSEVHEKGYRNNPLTDTQKESNKLKSKTRARVEHIFGFMTNSMNKGLNLKAIGIQRVSSLVGLLNLTYNMFRYEQLVRLQRVRIV
jgi:IS5 family transposase